MMKKILLTLLSIVLFVSLCACSENEDNNPANSSLAESVQSTSDETSTSVETPAAPSIKLPTNNLQLYIGQSAKLTPSAENVEMLYFQTSDDKVATIDQTGLITAVGVGTVTISVFGSGASANLTLNVLKPEDDASISFSSESVTVSFYDEVALEPIFVNCSGPFTWTSSDESVLTVDGNGMIFPKKIGTADVQVNGNGKGAKIKVIVVESETLHTVSYESDSISMITNDSFAFVTEVMFEGKSVSSYTATYEMADPTVASVSADGVVKGLKNGKTEMTVNIEYRGYNFTTKVVPVTVIGDIDIQLSEANLTIYTKDYPAQGYCSTAQVNATVVEDGSIMPDAEILWQSENEQIVTVSNGLLTAVAIGETKVYAYYTSVTGELAYAVLNVKVELTVVEFEAITVEAGTPDGVISGEEYLTLPAEMLGKPVSIVREDGNDLTLSEKGKVKISEILDLYEATENGWVVVEKLGVIADDEIKYTFDLNVITMIIRTAADLNTMADYGSAHPTAHTGYYVLGNDIVGGSVRKLSQYCGGDSYTTNGFRGVFDGQGHTISLVTLIDNYLFMGIGKGAIIKDFALVDPIQADETQPALCHELQNATISGVLVRADSEKAILGSYNNSVIKDSVFIIEKKGKHVIGTLGAWANHQTTLENLAIVVGDPTTVLLQNDAEPFAGLCGTHYVKGDYGTFKANKNIKEYVSVAALKAGLISDNFISQWNETYISFAEGNLKFNGKELIVMTDLSANGYAADFEYNESATEYTAKYALSQFAGAKSVTVNGEDYNVTVSDGNITIPAAAVNALLSGNTWGDFVVPLKTDTDAFLVKISVDAKELTGYYIVGQDFDAQESASDPVALVRYAGNNINNQEACLNYGFKGIFDGRGHVITNLTVKGGGYGLSYEAGYAKMSGLFGSIQQGAIIRDVAFINMECDNTNVGSIHPKTSQYTYLFTGESCSMRGAIENVVVTTQNSDRLFGFIRADKDSVIGYIKNLVFIGGNYFAEYDRSNDGVEGQRQGDKYKPSSKNIIMVTKNAQCRLAGSESTSAVYGATRYATTNEMLAALNSNNVIAGWNSPYISYVNGHLLFRSAEIL